MFDHFPAIARRNTSKLLLDEWGREAAEEI